MMSDHIVTDLDAISRAITSVETATAIFQADVALLGFYAAQGSLAEKTAALQALHHVMKQTNAAANRLRSNAQRNPQ